MKKLLLLITLIQCGFALSHEGAGAGAGAVKVDHYQAYDQAAYQEYLKNRQVEQKLNVSYDQWQKNGQALIKAANSNNIEDVQKLLEDSNINARDGAGNTVLMDAIIQFTYGRIDIKIIKLLLKHGADISATNIWGESLWQFQYLPLEIYALVLENNPSLHSQKTSKSGCCVIL